jgi:hypothetical protein
LVGVVAVLAAAGVYIADSRGGTSHPLAGTGSATTSPAGPLARRSLAAARAAAAPHVAVRAPPAVSASWTTVAQVYRRPAAWIAQRSGVTLLRLDQRLVHLTLHKGSSDGGVMGWTYGDQITPREIHLVLAAFNGGFKLTYTNVGFMSGGHVAVPLKPGLASIVTYTDGTTNIATWKNGVPSTRKLLSRSCKTSSCSSTAAWPQTPSRTV